MTVWRCRFRTLDGGEFREDMHFSGHPDRVVRRAIMRPMHGFLTHAFDDVPLDNIAHHRSYALVDYAHSNGIGGDAMYVEVYEPPPTIARAAPPIQPCPTCAAREAEEKQRASERSEAEAKRPHPYFEQLMSPQPIPPRKP
jgi:hypothetical protein